MSRLTLLFALSLLALSVVATSDYGDFEDNKNLDKMWDDFIKYQTHFGNDAESLNFEVNV